MNDDFFRELERARTQAIVARDMPLIERLHAPEYELVTPAGRVFSRARYLETIAAEPFYAAWDCGPMQVRWSADMAAVRYQARLVFPSGGAVACWHLDCYERRLGQWQAVWSQATRLPEPEPSVVLPLPSAESLVATLAAQGITLPPGPVRVDGYGDSAELSSELLDLIRSGRKRAGTGLLWAYEHDREPIAATGDIEIVVDHRNRPALVTRIVRSEIVAFQDVSAEYAAIEGEGDGSLEYWRKGHWTFFSRECRRIGREPSESMPVICNVFEVLHVLPVPGGG